MSTAKTLLIIEDNEAVREALRQAFLLEDYRVICAADSAEALAREQTGRADVVLLGVPLSSHGSAAVAEMQGFTAQAARPVVFMTGHPEHAARARAAGVTSVVEKPLDLPALFAQIRELTSPSATLADAFRTARAPAREAFGAGATCHATEEKPKSIEE